MNPNCAKCERAILRSYNDGGKDVICSVDLKSMKNYSMSLTECSQFREVTEEGKDTVKTLKAIEDWIDEARMLHNRRSSKAKG
jgi:hypothetical protein